MQESRYLAICWQVQFSWSNWTVLHRSNFVQGSQPETDSRSVRVRDGKADEARCGEIVVDRNRGSRNEVRRQNAGGCRQLVSY